MSSVRGPAHDLLTSALGPEAGALARPQEMVDEMLDFIRSKTDERKTDDLSEIPYAGEMSGEEELNLSKDVSML